MPNNGWDDDDDYNVEPGDDGLLNVGGEMPPWLERDDPDFEPSSPERVGGDGYITDSDEREIEAIAVDFGQDVDHVFSLIRFDAQDVGTGAGMYHQRATVYPTVGDALRAIADARLWAIAIVHYADGVWYVDVADSP